MRAHRAAAGVAATLIAAAGLERDVSWWMGDSPAGDVDYGVIGRGYASHRRPDARIEALIHAALGPARTLLNVGAGAGSYEPLDRHVIAIEPAAAMRVQRPRHLAPAIDARAEALPLDDASVDGSMALVTVHQWADPARGLAELRRVTRGRILIMTFDGDALDRYWLARYVPELMDAERRRYPAISALAAAVSTPSRAAMVRTVPIPIDCADGFTEAYYARPECSLDEGVTRAQSAWQFVSPEVRSRFARELAADLASGRWDAMYGHLRAAPWFEGSLRLIVGGHEAG